MNRTQVIQKVSRVITKSKHKGKYMFQDWKSPSGVLDWKFDWSDWLNEHDEITKYDILISQPKHPKKVTNKQTTLHNGVVVVWLGNGRKGTIYRITNKIKTKDGREEECYFDLKII